MRKHGRSVGCYHTTLGWFLSWEKAVSIHSFADMPEWTYGCCVCDVHELQRTFYLLFAKAKVAPSLAPALPRLELEAACLAARRLRLVARSLRIQVNYPFFWSESRIALDWISGDA